MVLLRDGTPLLSYCRRSRKQERGEERGVESALLVLMFCTCEEYATHGGAP